MSEFTPAELDALEDALESLEATPGSGDSGRPEHARVEARLAEYAQIMRWSREAMPLEDVPAGLLDRVLAEAEAAPHESMARVASPDAEAATVPWWKRWAAWMALSASAISATAALAFWVVQADAPAEASAVAVATPGEGTNEEPLPAAAPPPSAEPLASAEVFDEGLLAQAPPEDAGKEIAFGKRREQRGAGAMEDDAMPVQSRPTPRKGTSPARKPEAPEIPRKRASSSPSADLEPNLPPPEMPAAAPIGEDAQAAKVPKVSESEKKKDASSSATAMEVLDRADRDRRQQNCAAAQYAYAGLSHDERPDIRARALAGLGLCEALIGRRSEAERYFARARAADPKVAGFIRREREALDGQKRK